jgi:AmmeMemoRadiSam system protein B
MIAARRTPIVAVTLLILAAASWGAEEPAVPPSRAEIENGMGLPSEGDRVRGQRDTLGFVVSAAQAQDVVESALEDEAGSLAEGDAFLGGISPHDDHLYAGRVYVHLTHRIRAPRVVLIGVFHRARYWNLDNRLVFDAFEAWHGPWGPVQVDPLRAELLDALPEGDIVVDNAMHAMEHSLEAIVPFLQYENRDVTIVPILVPYVDWDQLSRLSDRLAATLAAVMNGHGWKLGRDVAIVISSDAVHYGEDFDHAPFGADAEAYRRAVAREDALIQNHLAGPIDPERLKGLLFTLVDPEDVRTYRLPWCGRFSVPFGVELIRKTALALGEPVPVGHRLRYGTSLSEAELPVSAETRDAGLGYTAPSNFHHWVGYAAVGFLPPDTAGR